MKIKLKNTTALVPAPEAELLTTAEAARLLRCQEQTLRKWRLTGQGPLFIKVGSRTLYRRTDLDEWLTVRTYASTAAVREAP